MRKETILNYEKEFLAWCKGESILLGAPASMHEKPLVWREVRDFNDWKPLDTVYVLNDSYSTYRKALAEGKSIQMLCRYDKMEPIWDDMTEVIKSIGFVDVKENYRIKPEEPKFKVGDWVVNKTSKQRIIKKVTSVYSDSVTVGDSTVGINVMSIENLELWQPQPGEWCWVFDTGTYVPVLRKFICFDDDLNAPLKYIVEGHDGRSHLPFKFIEPFIGVLPSKIKQY